MPNPIRAADSLLPRLAGEAQPSVIRAYHGSPYDFDKFDASKIGTGEGAQAYGHGLYFAGNESIASGYRTRLAGSYSPATLAPDADLPTYFAPGNVINGYGGRDKVLNFHQPKDAPWDWSVEVIGVDKAGNPLYGERPRVHKTSPSIDEVDRFLGRTPRRPGHTYEVEIAHPERSLLDWDAPIKEQGDLRDRLQGVANHATTRAGYKSLRDRARGPYTTGLDYMIQAAHYIDPAWPHNNRPSPRRLAVAMAAEGIPGIRYFDQGSRAAGQGTRNYVMFPGTEDQIRILRKYAVPGAIAAGAASPYGEEQ